MLGESFPLLQTGDILEINLNLNTIKIKDSVTSNNYLMGCYSDTTKYLLVSLISQNTSNTYSLRHAITGEDDKRLTIKKSNTVSLKLIVTKKALGITSMLKVYSDIKQNNKIGELLIEDNNIFNISNDFFGLGYLNSTNNSFSNVGTLTPLGIINYNIILNESVLKSYKAQPSSNGKGFLYSELDGTKKELYVNNLKVLTPLEIERYYEKI